MKTIFKSFKFKIDPMWFGCFYIYYMILDKFINIEMKGANIRFYKEKYNCIVGDIVSIDITDLRKGTSLLVNTECDVCGSFKKLSYRKYIKSINNGGYYSCSSKCSTNKKKNTYIENYGVDSPLKCDMIKDKMKITCINKYGVDNPMKNDDVKKRSRETCLDRYDSETYVSSELYKEKMNEIYGVDNSMQSIEVNSKRIKSSFNMGEYGDIKYQGSYELDFLKQYHNKVDIIRPEFTIKYTDNDDTEKSYLPDFYIPSKNLVIEIKSTYYYNLHLELNLLKKKSTIESGYNYLLIMDKNYNELNIII